MADDIKKIIVLGVELDLSKLLSTAVEARRVLDELKAKQKELEAQGQKNSTQFEENAAAIRKANVALKEAIAAIDGKKSADTSAAEATKKTTEATTAAATAADKSATATDTATAATEKATAAILTAESQVTQAITREAQEQAKLSALKTKEAIESEKLAQQKIKEAQETEKLNALKAKSAVEIEKIATAEELAKIRIEKETIKLDATRESASARAERNAQREASAYVALSRELDNNKRIIKDLLAAKEPLSKADEDLIARTRDLDAQLKKIDATVGDHKRNVGDYAGAIGETVGRLNLLPGSLGNAAQSVNGLSSAFKLLLLNPVVLVIAAIVAALGLLYKAFTTTDEGATKMEAIFKSIGAVLSVVTQRLATLASGLVAVFTGDLLGGAEKVKNAFTGIGEQMREAASAAYDYVIAMDAINDANINFVSQTAKNRNEIAKLQAIAADQTQTLAVREAALKRSLEIGEQELKFVQSQAQKTYEETLKSEARRVGIKEETLRKFIEADNDAANALLESDKSLANARNILNDEGQDALEKLFTDSLNKETEFFESNKRNISKLSGFRKQADADALAATKDRIEKTEAAELSILINNKNVIELRLQGEKEYSDEYLADKIKLFEAEKAIELNNKKLTANQKLIIENETNDKINVFTRNFLNTQKELALEALQVQLDTAEALTDNEQLRLATSALNREKFAAEQLEAGVISEQEYQDRIAEIRFEAEQAARESLLEEVDFKLESLTLSYDEELKLRQQKADLENAIATATATNQIAQQKKVAKSQEQLLQQEIEGYKTFGGTLKSLFAENTTAYKLFASIEATANTAAAAIAAYKSVVGIPIVGPVLAPIAAAAASAYGALQIAKINGLAEGGIVPRAGEPIKKKERGGVVERVLAYGGIVSPETKPVRREVYPKAAKGILLGGQPHSRGGTKFHGTDGTRFEAEKDELLVVINKRSTGMLRNLSDINVAGGGVAFERGGVAKGKEFLLDGGFAARAASVPVIQNVNNLNGITDALANVKLAVAVQDINEAVDSLATVEDRAIIQ